MQGFHMLPMSSPEKSYHRVHVIRRWLKNEFFISSLTIHNKFSLVNLQRTRQQNIRKMCSNTQINKYLICMAIGNFLNINSHQK